jgi:hypothetical protein
VLVIAVDYDLLDTAAFDDDKSSIPGNGTLEFRENNTVVSSTSGSHSVCLLSHGGFKTGKVCCALVYSLYSSAVASSVSISSIYHPRPVSRCALKSFIARYAGTVGIPTGGRQ